MPQLDPSQREWLTSTPARVSRTLTGRVPAPGGCTALGELPVGFGGLSALQKLDLFGCAALAVLPDSFGNLASLLELDLSNCTSLRPLPEAFGKLHCPETN